MKESITIEYAGRPLTISTGEVAKQANGSVVVQYGDTVVLVTAVAESEPKDKDFLPLTVNYQEMSYAAGRFPGGFFKREGRPHAHEVLTSRLIDRPLRPLFPKGYRNETQVVATVLSVDQENDPAMLSMLGASCALYLSDIPWDGPIAGIKVGRIEGRFIVNPTMSEMAESEMDVVVTGMKDAIVMVEGAANFVAGADLIEAIEFAHESLAPLIEVQERLREKAGKPKWFVPVDEKPVLLKNEIKDIVEKELVDAFSISGKLERGNKIKEIYQELRAEHYPDTNEALLSNAFEDVSRDVLRGQLLATGKRIDGRATDQVRPITCQTGLLPRTHGSALFTRGETQALAITTFGTSEDEQKIESLMEGESFKTFILHYNFPPFATGETGMHRGPSRREIGHGNLAERALIPILPSKEEFPYTIRVVSEILESNGSSSMATVCSGCLSLMDAGVPVKDVVAGIAMGLVKEGETEIVLSDILGDEDHLGDMDFKLAGTQTGITAIQMDIKIKGITKETMSKTVAQGQKGIEHILGIMREALSGPRESMSPYAPRIVTIRINPDKIRDVIGPGGKVIKGIIEQTGVKMDIDDSGTIHIASPDESAVNMAIDIVKKLTKEAELGAIYTGKVRKVLDAGAIVEIMPGTDGFVHISQISDSYVKKVSEVVKEGDEIQVKVIDIEANGRIKLSRKAALKEQERKQVED